MVKLNKNSNGFTVFEVLLVLLTFAIIVAAGYFIAKHINKKPVVINTIQTPTSSSPKPVTTKTTTTSLAGGKVTFALPDNLKAVHGGYNEIKGACGQSVGSSAKCIDSIALNPKAEPFTNPDQFHVTIAVFSSNNITNASDWYKNYVNATLGGADTFTNLKINGLSAIYERADYSNYGASEKVNQEVRLGYGVVSSNYGVLVTSVLYKGDYYSAKNTSGVDYHQYQPTIDTLAKSVKISD